MKPNIIVFFTDQQRWDTAGMHGNPLDLTPNFDRMALRGTFAPYAFTCQPVCGPARACLQTGTYATANGVYRNGIPLREGDKTIADYFNEAGYQTAYIGKWHLAATRTNPVPAGKRGGYRYWLAADSLEHTSDAYDTRVFDGNDEEVRLPGYRVDALTDAAIRFMDGKKDSEDPFFLFLSFLEPHHQNRRDDYPAPDIYRGKFTSRYTPPDLMALQGTAHQQLDGVYGMVKRLDEALGRLFDALKSMRILEHTIVVFASDHGNHFKTRNREYKRSGHESSIRIPLALSGQGFDGGGRLDGLVSLIDLPPTLLDAAGIPVPPHMQGRSILPLVRDRGAAWPQEVFVQISESQVGRAIRTKRWKYGIHAPGRDPVKDSGSDEYEEQYLYDLAADPYELTNLVDYASHEAVRAHLRSVMLKRMKEAGEAEPLIHPAASKPSGQRLVSDEEICQ